MFESTQITIVGAGLMGCGIAHVFANKGIQVTLYDPVQQAREQALQRIRHSLENVGEEITKADKVRVESDLQQALSGATVVIEAAPEKLELKRKIFSQCLEHCSSDCIIASNTSVIPIHNITEDLEFNGRVVGTHWWNPPYLVPLVEVVQSEQTSSDTIDAMMALLTYVGKKPAHVKKDIAGFVGNRLQHALWREAIALVNDGVCDAETLDMVVKNSFGMRLPVLGPIENADLVGLDLTLDIHNVILPYLNRGTSPASILQQKVNAKQLGVKTHSGFKQWTPDRIDTLRSNLNSHLISAVSKQEVQHEKE